VAYSEPLENMQQNQNDMKKNLTVLVAISAILLISCDGAKKELATES